MVKVIKYNPFSKGKTLTEAQVINMKALGLKVTTETTEAQALKLARNLK